MIWVCIFGTISGLCPARGPGFGDCRPRSRSRTWPRCSCGGAGPGSRGWRHIRGAVHRPWARPAAAGHICSSCTASNRALRASCVYSSDFTPPSCPEPVEGSLWLLLGLSCPEFIEGSLTFIIGIRKGFPFLSGLVQSFVTTNLFPFLIYHFAGFNTQTASFRRQCPVKINLILEQSLAHF